MEEKTPKRPAHLAICDLLLAWEKEASPAARWKMSALLELLSTMAIPADHDVVAETVYRISSFYTEEVNMLRGTEVIGATLSAIWREEASRRDSEKVVSDPLAVERARAALRRTQGEGSCFYVETEGTVHFFVLNSLSFAVYSETEIHFRVELAKKIS